MQEKDYKQLFEMLLDAIDNYAEPDWNDPGNRQWNCDFGAYHRDCVLFSGGIDRVMWESLRPHLEKRFRR